MTNLNVNRFEVNRFEVWEKPTLAKFAKEANEKLITQAEEIEILKQDLRVALDAYRTLIVKNAGKTD